MNYLAVVCAHTFFSLSLKRRWPYKNHLNLLQLVSPLLIVVFFYFIPIHSAAISWAAPCWLLSLCTFLQSVKLHLLPPGLEFLRLFTQDRDKLLFPLQFREAWARTWAWPRPWQEHTPTRTHTRVQVFVLCKHRWRSPSGVLNRQTYLARGVGGFGPALRSLSEQIWRLCALG